MIFKRLKILLELVLVSILLSCSGNGSNSDNDFYLNDTSKLGVEISDHDMGVSFYPPKDWILMPASLSKKTEARLGGVNSPENFIYQPLYVFLNKSTRGILSIGKVNSNDSTLTQNAVFNYYKSILAEKYQDNNLTIGKFTKSKIPFSQFKFRKENLTSIKLLFENNRKELIQLDYSIPEIFFDSTEVFIKSSIGSIKLF